MAEISSAEAEREEDAMIHINDNDTPCLVANKIIYGTKEGKPNKLAQAFGQIGGDDMFDIDEIKEIAEHLLIYYNTYKDRD